MGIDTQGMTLPLDPNFKGRPLEEQQSNLGCRETTAKL